MPGAGMDWSFDVTIAGTCIGALALLYAIGSSRFQHWAAGLGARLDHQDAKIDQVAQDTARTPLGRRPDRGVHRRRIRQKDRVTRWNPTARISVFRRC
jgi:hypothetical protein